MQKTPLFWIQHHFMIKPLRKLGIEGMYSHVSHELVLETLTGADRRCWKRQQTEDQTCTNLGPGRLGTQMETHSSPLHLQ
jgi:hypothetical protein